MYYRSRGTRPVRTWKERAQAARLMRRTAGPLLAFGCVAVILGLIPTGHPPRPWNPKSLLDVGFGLSLVGGFGFFVAFMAGFGEWLQYHADQRSVHHWQNTRHVSHSPLPVTESTGDLLGIFVLIPLFWGAALVVRYLYLLAMFLVERFL